MKKGYLLIFAFVLGAFSMQAQSPLSGKTFVLAPVAQALAVGPTQGDASWWSSTTGDLTTRACFFDDLYVFEADGTFRNELGADTWLETWQGASSESCGAPVAPHDGSASATWTYDATAGTVTINGTGAYLGLPKVHNTGELTTPADAVSSITYLAAFSANNDTMTLDINFGNGADGWWRFVLIESTPSNTNEVANEDLFSVFPNPATDQIQVQSDEQIDELSIYDVTGKLVFTQQTPAINETVDVSNLQSGLYILQARIGDKISVEKLMVQ